MKLNAMQKWEEQQRLKLMSKKIASAKSVLRKENMIGERGKVAPANNWGNVDNSNMITPMQSDDSGQIVMRKVPVKKRPEWKDINHQDYKGGGSASAARPQYIERRRPHRISVRTPDSARNVLLKELGRAEALVKRGKKSPTASARKAAEDMGSELELLRNSLGSGKKSTPGSAAGVGRRVRTPAEDDDLVASIDALSSVLDSKLALIAEASCENLVGTASSFVAGATSDAVFLKLQNIAESAAQQAVDSHAPTNPPAAAPSEDDPVVRADMNGLDDSSDVCLMSDSVDDAADVAKEMAVGGEKVEGGEGGEGDEDGDYDDDFERGDGDGDGDEERVSDEVVDKLNQTRTKLDLLEKLMTPANGAVQKEAAEDVAEADTQRGAGGVAPDSETDSHAPAAAVQAAAHCRDEELVKEGATQEVAPAVAAAPAVVAAPVSRIGSKPFSFKLKAGVGGSAGAGGGGEANQMPSANGPTMLNGDNNNPRPLAPNPAPAKVDPVAAFLAKGEYGAAAPASQDTAVGNASAPQPKEHPAAAPGDAAAVPALAGVGGGRAGRGLLNLKPAGAHDNRDPSPLYQPSNASAGGRAGRSLLDLGGAKADSSAAMGVHESGGMGVGGRVSSAASQYSIASAQQDARREWNGSEAGSEPPSRGVSAGGKKKISKEEIRRAMLAAQGVSNKHSTETSPVEPAAPPPLVLQPPAGRRRATTAEEEEAKPLGDDLFDAEPRSARSAYSSQYTAGVRAVESNAGRVGALAVGSGADTFLDLDQLGGPDNMGGDESAAPSLPSARVGGRRGPVRANGPPRFAAGIGAEAKATVAAVTSFTADESLDFDNDGFRGRNGGFGVNGGGMHGGGAAAGRRSPSHVDSWNLSLEELDLGAGVAAGTAVANLGGGGGGGRVEMGGVGTRGEGGLASVRGGGGLSSVALDSSLDRSLECEML